MHFSEDDLRAALQRKEPGADFTGRVMARVNQAGKAAQSESGGRKMTGSLLSWWRLRPAWTLAVAALLLFACSWAGYQYSEYRHSLIAKQEQQHLEQIQKQREQAERARDQAILALRMARSKLNHVLEQAQVPAEGDKIRRQRL